MDKTHWILPFECECERDQKTFGTSNFIIHCQTNFRVWPNAFLDSLAYYFKENGDGEVSGEHTQYHKPFQFIMDMEPMDGRTQGKF